MRVILLGAPGAGKGTQGALLAKKHGVERISTGELLREAVRRGTALGQEAKRYMDAGELVPDDVILGMVREVLGGAGGGFILDGFPRTLEQAEGLDALLEELELRLDAVLVLRVDEDVLVKRLSGRRSCPECNAVYNIYFDPPAVAGVCDECGAKLVERADDDADTVRRRLQVYERQTRPLIDYYERSGTPVKYIDGDQPVEAVQAAIAAMLKPA
ncbi:MAG: adenylate kinase [Gemmatimonadetes bacterium]|nr:adenylate kinase [Gemmatimonadota bacterium]NIU76553.1 adenylate kinase [Gammaproteobacteria bacterium]NIQ56360.1 adenylate kinase [Gemmatimonadota bacterium]NIW35266.1 adenylate kinase [Gemmatimonadota bacterium]NIX46006.1 adenylate kinase [Gemmatimonadota bacterium]